MNICQAVGLAMQQTGKWYDKTDAAKALGCSRNHFYQILDAELTKEQLLGLEEYWGISLITPASAENIHTKDDAWEIPYWERCAEFDLPLKNPLLITKWDDKTFYKYANKNYKNIRLINMFNDRMDGGVYPIAQNEVIIIDIGDTNYNVDGTFLFTTGPAGNEALSIARIESRLGGKSYYFTYPNEAYKHKSRPIDVKELKELNFKVHARVIKNGTRFI